MTPDHAQFSEELPRQSSIATGQASPVARPEAAEVAVHALNKSFPHIEWTGEGINIAARIVRRHYAPLLAANAEEIARLRDYLAGGAAQNLMTNRQHLTAATDALAAILADIKEKNGMIDAGETHGAEWARREDDLGECQVILENMQTELERLDYLL